MVIDTPFLHCFFCGRRFSPDPEAKEGKFIRAWKVAVCLRCVVGNPEGLLANHPAIKQLAQRGIILKPSKDGLVSWPENGRRPAPAICRTYPEPNSRATGIQR
jgi:hypothetical protein